MAGITKTKDPPTGPIDRDAAGKPTGVLKESAKELIIPKYSHAQRRKGLLWAARRLFLEDRVGSIEPGKDAAIAVWDRDLYTMSADEIRNLQCELTLVGGTVVYER